MNSEKREGMLKVRFSFEKYSETVWATPLEGNLYQLDNSPFFAYGVSWRDTVEARMGADHILEFVRCIRKSGNRTVRIVFQAYRSTDSDADEVLKGLLRMGCSYEGMPPRLISVNVPLAVDLSAVVEFLKDQTVLQWEYADPTYEQVVGRLN